MDLQVLHIFTNDVLFSATYTFNSIGKKEAIFSMATWRRESSRGAADWGGPQQQRTESWQVDDVATGSISDSRGGRRQELSMDAVSRSSGRRPAIRATDCSSAPPCRWLARTLRQPSSPWLGGHRHELDHGGQPAQTLARVLGMYPVTRSRGTEASYLPPHSLKLQRRGGRRLRALVAGCSMRRP